MNKHNLLPIKTRKTTPFNCKITSSNELNLLPFNTYEIKHVKSNDISNRKMSKFLYDTLNILISS